MSCTGHVLILCGNFCITEMPSAQFRLKWILEHSLSLRIAGTGLPFGRWNECLSSGIDSTLSTGCVCVYDSCMFWAGKLPTWIWNLCAVYNLRDGNFIWDCMRERHVSYSDGTSVSSTRKMQPVSDNCLGRFGTRAERKGTGEGGPGSDNSIDTSQLAHPERWCPGLRTVPSVRGGERHPLLRCSGQIEPRHRDS